MRHSKILARVRAGKSARLAMMGHFLPPFIAHAAHLGFDGVWIDLEHNPFDDRELQSLLAFCHLYDIDAMIRPPTREKARLYRYLEDGASGLMIPHVNDAQAARDLAQSVKFPPEGDRGLFGRGLEASFGLDEKDAYLAHARRETFLMVQLETPVSLTQAEAMAAVPAIDGLYVGPSDLGLRLDLLPEGERLSVETAIEQVGTICKRHGKIWGSLPRSADELRHHAGLGSNLLVWGIDWRMLQDGLTQASRDIEQALRQSG